MNHQPIEQHTITTPWKSATLCLLTSLIGLMYPTTQVGKLVQVFRDNEGATDAELNALCNPLAIDIMTVTAIIMGFALIPGMINVMLVARGGRKWTLMISVIGILVSLACLILMALIWLYLPN